MHALSNRIKPSGENAFIAFLTGDQEVVQILTLIVINAKTFSQDKPHKTLNITALMLICACSSMRTVTDFESARQNEVHVILQLGFELFTVPTFIANISISKILQTIILPICK